MPYRPQSNRAERMHHTLIQMILYCIGSHHTNWDPFLQRFAYTLRKTVLEITGKAPAKLFLGRNITTAYQKLVMVSNAENKFAC